MSVKLFSKDLIDEWQILSKVLRSLWSLDKSTRQLISKRHKQLEEYILSLLYDDVNMAVSCKKALSQSESIRRDFLCDVLDSFITMNRQYIDILRNYGLTKSEINHCCLLTLGLTSKEAGFISYNRNHYNHSSQIRSKFELSSKDTNLSIFLKTLYEKCQCETSSVVVPKISTPPH